MTHHIELASLVTFPQKKVLKVISSIILLYLTYDDTYLTCFELDNFELIWRRLFYYPIRQSFCVLLPHQSRANPRSNSSFLLLMQCNMYMSANSSIISKLNYEKDNNFSLIWCLMGEFICTCTCHANSFLSMAAMARWIHSLRQFGLLMIHLAGCTVGQEMPRESRN